MMFAHERTISINKEFFIPNVQDQKVFGRLCPTRIFITLPPRRILDRGHWIKDTSLARLKITSFFVLLIQSSKYVSEISIFAFFFQIVLNFEFTTRKMLPIFDFKRLHCVELVHSNTSKMIKNNQTNSGDQTDEKDSGRRMERTAKRGGIQMTQTK